MTCSTTASCSARSRSCRPSTSSPPSRVRRRPKSTQPRRTSSSCSHSTRRTSSSTSAKRWTGPARSKRAAAYGFLDDPHHKLGAEDHIRKPVHVVAHVISYYFLGMVTEQGHLRGLRARQRVFLARPLGGRGSTLPATPSAPAACGNCGCGFAGAPSKTGRGHHHCCPPCTRPAAVLPQNAILVQENQNLGYGLQTRAVAWFDLFLGYPSVEVHNGRCLLSELKTAPSGGRGARCCRGTRRGAVVPCYGDDTSHRPWSSACVCSNGTHDTHRHAHRTGVGGGQ